MEFSGHLVTCRVAPLKAEAPRVAKTRNIIVSPLKLLKLIHKTYPVELMSHAYVLCALNFTVWVFILDLSLHLTSSWTKLKCQNRDGWRGVGEAALSPERPAESCSCSVPTFAILAWLLESHWSNNFLLGFLLVCAKSTGLQPILTLSRSNQDNPESCPTLMILFSRKGKLHIFYTSYILHFYK